MANVNILDALWIEKYRPKKMNDVVLPQEQRDFFDKCLLKNDVPSCLFLGPPGSGKCHDGDEEIMIYRLSQENSSKKIFSCLTLNFSSLFTLFSSSYEADEIHKTKERIFVTDLRGQFTEIRGLIKKSNQTILTATFSNGIKHSASDGHLLKVGNTFKKFGELVPGDIVPLNNKTVICKFEKSEFKKVDCCYDISIDYPHEYSTPNGLIHHNTTLARIVKDSIIKNDMDILEMNGSDNTGVDVVRDMIIPFLKCPPVKSQLKIVFIDEFDFTTGNMQGCLRNVMEKYCEIGRFICTANYKSKIIDPLLSRFQVFEMKTISEEFAIKYCEKILTTENIQYDVEEVRLIVQSLVPDVRKIVNTMQKNVIDGKLSKVKKDDIISLEKKVIAYIVQICDSIGTNSQNNIINSAIPAIEDIVSQNEIDYMGCYGQLFHEVNLPLWGKICVNKYCNMHMSCAIPSIHFIAMVWEIINNGVNYNSMFNKK